ncbi:MAG: UDP-N-acetylglucosamine--N-acetylmuramyl-(pentapeptide) pyrophosphoryl-undecaprenol N-acetylglucosamine transferase, partial [Sulfurovum sp.]|nr:UDP-N-acetylglucosamine--N-acetylmuramyl-(pentapeptide) pyrophosphoryl-undecaprenol N-acetylglucosamine transferase [Sulfurovaceae bacterium]
MSIVMTGGGTGGHLTIIKAVKEHINDSNLIYIGSKQGQDSSWFKNDTDFKEKYFLKTRGVVNQGFLGKIKSIYMLIKATREAMILLDRHNVKIVFSVGGFSSAPTAFASKIKKIPLIIHEQNASMGSLNKLLQPYAYIFISSYLENSPIKAYPIKDIFFKNAHIRENINSIIFLGGSQGAKAINSLALSLAPILNSKGIRIIHQAGEKNIDEIQEKYKKLDIHANVFGFTTQLDKYMNMADFAIARAGASTLWELSASGIPTIYIPYPYASHDHQYYNAKYFVDKNLSWILREDNHSSNHPSSNHPLIQSPT